MVSGLRENDSAEEGVLQTSEGEEVCVVILAICSQQRQEKSMQRTGGVGADNSQTSELLGDSEDHYGKGAFLVLI